MHHSVYVVFLEHDDPSLEKKFLDHLSDLEDQGYTLRIIRGLQVERTSRIITPDDDSRIIKPGE